MNVLEVSGAAKRFADVPALQGADLHLAAGECLGLLGPNGAGKTTLLRSLVGRVRLDAGTVRLFDRDVTRGLSREMLGQIGVVPQELAIYPLLTAEENLHAFGRFCGLGDAELRARVAWALSWSGLSERAREPVARFSGGMKRRLNIACGVLHRPRLILLDEPTVGVDPQSRQRIWEMCSELRRDNAALLLTTHQLDEAQHVCSRITIIDHGRTAASGTMAELVAKTVGPQRRVTLHLTTPIASAPQGSELTNNGATLRSAMLDVAAELPRLLDRVRDAGGRIEDVHVDAPTLQDVFLHLTGRELRE